MFDGNNLGTYIITVNRSNSAMDEETRQLISITLPVSCGTAYFLAHSIDGDKFGIESGTADWRMFSC